MEVWCMESHGGSFLLREKTFLLSDMYKIYICDHCGLFSNFNPRKTVNTCKICDNSDFSQIEIPYACKLLFQELMAMGIAPRMFPKK